MTYFFIFIINLQISYNFYNHFIKKQTTFAINPPKTFHNKSKRYKQNNPAEFAISTNPTGSYFSHIFSMVLSHHT